MGDNHNSEPTISHADAVSALEAVGADTSGLSDEQENGISGGHQEDGGTNSETELDEATNTNTSDESDETPNESQDSDNEDGDGDGEEPEDADDVSDGIREDKSDDNKDIRKGGKNANTRIRELVSEVKHYKNELAKRQQQEEIAKLQAEDPVYTREDFNIVVDEDGDAIQLTPEQADAEYAKWRAGYLERQIVRDQQMQLEMAQTTRVHDEIAQIISEYPEFDANSDKFDKELSDTLLPLIENSLQYNNSGQVIGTTVSLRELASGLSKIANRKPTLSLNKISSAENRSSVSTPKSGRTGTTKQAQEVNEMYKELGIKYRY